MNRPIKGANGIAILVYTGFYVPLNQAHTIFLHFVVVAVFVYAVLFFQTKPKVREKWLIWYWIKWH